MKPTHLIFLPFCAALLTGCPTRLKGDANVDSGSGDVADADQPQSDGADADGGRGTGNSDGGDASDVVEVEAPLPTLVISAPATGLHTNGTVNVTVMLAGGDTPPAPIAILENGATIATISAPFAYAWDTTTVPEGTYTLVAQTTVGGRVTASSPINIVVDRTAPTILSLTPSPAAVGVVFSAPIGVVFSEPILAAAFPAGAVTMTSGATSVAATASLATDGTTATVKLNDPSTVLLPTTLIAAFAATITDLAGNKLVQPIAPWQWTVPDWIKTASFAANGIPYLAVDPKGTPFIAYGTTTPQANSTLAYGVSVSRYDGQTWKDLTLPTSPTSTSSTGYSLAVDASGHPTAAWLETDTGGLTVHVATSDGAKWTPLPALDAFAAPGTHAESPVLKLDSKGSPVVAWREETGSGSDIFVGHWTGSAWDKSFGGLGFDGVATVFGLDLVLGPNDSPVVGWFTAQGVGVATWATTWTRSTDSHSGSSPSIGIDAAGKPLIVVRHGGIGVQVLTGAQWQGEPTTPVPAAPNGQNPALAMTPAHQPVVGWLDTTGPNKFGLARWNGTNKWDTRAGLFHGAGTLDIAVPGLVVDAQDHIWVAWLESGQIYVWMSNY